ncbi:unnamed protein product [Larinioides sclopetarius]|uniref:Uncharacterized protein n=1 Tax=Larinioides sclopetarius TaxID=280406 RepID=A0AAV1Z2S3_9ARAC
MALWAIPSSSDTSSWCENAGVLMFSSISVSSASNPLHQYGFLMTLALSKFLSSYASVNTGNPLITFDELPRGVYEEVIRSQESQAVYLADEPENDPSHP